MPHTLVAPNAFKHALSAQEASDAIIAGLEKSNSPCQTTVFPIGDGGDGTCQLLHEALQGQLVFCEVQDPLGRPLKTSYSLVDHGQTAVIEMADASGLRLLKTNERSVMRTSSFGTGQMIAHALDRGIRRIILGMGGSATIDGGCGLLHALGTRFLDGYGNVLHPIPRDLLSLASIDIDQLDKRLMQTEIIVMCDVKNKLLGQQGAAAVFGPQKGANDDEVRLLDTFLERLAAIVRTQTGNDMTTVTAGGTAGGAAAGVFALLNAKLENGIDLFLDLAGFDKVLSKADIVITGEGSLDEQSLSGKGPYGVAIRAKQKGIPVIGLAGRVPLQPSKALLDTFDLLLPIGNSPVSLEEALQATSANLNRTAQTIGNLLTAFIK